ncbi:signal peptidase I [Enterococcus rivorum]|nr:signal peptidase I [Enterococcus rivorum]MBP2097374.1 signal peptidase I [Enterococcus rivorum]
MEKDAATKIQKKKIPTKKRKRKKTSNPNRKKQSERIVKKRINQKNLPKKKQLKRKRRKSKESKNVFNRVMLELSGAIFLVGFVLWFLSFFTFTFVKIDGYAMMPTLSEKDLVFVNRLGPKKRFKLVYIRLPNGAGTCVRRIVGLPGEQIEYLQDQLYVNHQKKEETFILDEKRQADSNGIFYTENFTMNQQFNEVTIPTGKYLVMGDNRPYATDSRYYGFVGEKEIIGTVEMRVLPLHKMEQY